MKRGSKNAPAPFDRHDLLIADTCILLRMTRGEFASLPGDEQEYWIAVMRRKQMEREDILKSIRRMEYPDAGATVQTLLALI